MSLISRERSPVAMNLYVWNPGVESIDELASMSVATDRIVFNSRVLECHLAIVLKTAKTPVPLSSSKELHSACSLVHMFAAGECVTWSNDFLDVHLEVLHVAVGHPPLKYCSRLKSLSLAVRSLFPDPFPNLEPARTKH